MNAGILGLLGALVVAQAAYADGIVSVVNNADSAVTVRVDGNFGCRAQSKASAPPDVDQANRCSFGTGLGSHMLEFHYDDGKTASRTVAVPQTGYALTLTGSE